MGRVKPDATQRVHDRTHLRRFVIGGRDEYVVVTGHPSRHQLGVRPVGVAGEVVPADLVDVVVAGAWATPMP